MGLKNVIVTYLIYLQNELLTIDLLENCFAPYESLQYVIVITFFVEHLMKVRILILASRLIAIVPCCVAMEVPQDEAGHIQESDVVQEDAETIRNHQNTVSSMVMLKRAKLASSRKMSVYPRPTGGAPRSPREALNSIGLSPRPISRSPRKKNPREVDHLDLIAEQPNETSPRTS